jgi:hypothetical protein
MWAKKKRVFASSGTIMILCHNYHAIAGFKDNALDKIKKKSIRSKDKKIRSGSMLQQTTENTVSYTCGKFSPSKNHVTEKCFQNAPSSFPLLQIMPERPVSCEIPHGAYVSLLQFLSCMICWFHIHHHH